MGRESSDASSRADGGGRRAMRLMVVTIAIACVSHLVDATHAATMGAALDAGARAVSSNAVGAFARGRTREKGDDGTDAVRIGWILLRGGLPRAAARRRRRRNSWANPRAWSSS